MFSNFLSLAHKIAEVAKPVQSDLEQELRRNLKLRRELGVQAAKAKDESADQLGSIVNQAKTAPDDLETLRLELKLRRAMNAAGPIPGDAETPLLLSA
jgi:hypothetical protein